MLETIEIKTGNDCQYAVIWLHGLGASGHDFEPIVPELRLPTEVGVRFVFPHAPTRPITINGGMPMRGWYDITSLDFSQREQDIAGTQASSQLVGALVEREIDRGIPADHIVLAGFSQGGAIALYHGLTSHHAFAGILALSTYLPIQEQTLSLRTPENQNTAIFLAHGTYDDVIALQYAEQSRDVLVSNQYSVQWKTYPMPHSVSPEEIQDISAWLQKQIAN